MRFFSLPFHVFFIALAFAFQANASGLMGTIVSREMGLCSTNNLSFTAMKFYKIPQAETYEDRPVFLRVLFFFNNDFTVTTRVTKQALISCQTLPSGDEACAYRPLEDQWIKNEKFEMNDRTIQTALGDVNFINPENINRGFEFHFQGKKFIGGMVQVNFNQHGVNTARLCQTQE